MKIFVQHFEGTFQNRVYEVIEKIPRGWVVSYGQIAAALGKPRGAREVGWAMRNCPDHLPWQRVLMADGSVAGGGYADMRRALLVADGVGFLADGRVDMENFRAEILPAGHLRTMDVVPYDADWATDFEKMRAVLQDIFSDTALDIQHFGSTAVPGLAAKPTIDILIFVDNIADVDGYVNKMLAAGYQAHGEFGIKNRRYFVRKIDNKHTHHVHVYEQGHKGAADELLFRDFLRTDPTARQEYAALKLELSQKFYTQPLEYNAGKSDCIFRLMQRAMAND